MFKVMVDDRCNTITTIFEGDFTIEQGGQWYAAVEKRLPRLRKGFNALADLSSLTNMNIEVKKSIEKAMDLLNQHGVARVIRIIPDPGKDIGFKIMSLFHYSHDVKICTCQSWEEAEKYLHNE